MTDSRPALTPDAAEWPDFAPAWAERAEWEADGQAVTFALAWVMPSVRRGTEPLEVVQVRQTFTFDPDSAAHEPGLPWIVAGPGELWADERRGDVAGTLRALAEVLDPQASPTRRYTGPPDDFRAAVGIHVHDLNGLRLGVGQFVVNPGPDDEVVIEVFDEYARTRLVLALDAAARAAISEASLFRSTFPFNVRAVIE